MERCSRIVDIGHIVRNVERTAKQLELVESSKRNNVEKLYLLFRHGLTSNQSKDLYFALLSRLVGSDFFPEQQNVITFLAEDYVNRRDIDISSEAQNLLIRTDDLVESLAKEEQIQAQFRKEFVKAYKSLSTDERIELKKQFSSFPEHMINLITTKTDKRKIFRLKHVHSIDENGKMTTGVPEWYKPEDGITSYDDIADHIAFGGQARISYGFMDGLVILKGLKGIHTRIKAELTDDNRYSHDMIEVNEQVEDKSAERARQLDTMILEAMAKYEDTFVETMREPAVNGDLPLTGLIKEAYKTTYKKAITEIQKQVRLQAQFKHKNILPLLSVIDHGRTKVYPFVPGKDTKWNFNRYRQILFDEGAAELAQIEGKSVIETRYKHMLRGKHLKAWVTDACSGLQYMADMNLVHADVQPENFYWIRNGSSHVILGDADSARVIGSKDFQMSATFGYMPRENYEITDDNNHMSKKVKSDMFSLKQIVLEFLTGYAPIMGFEDAERCLDARDPVTGFAMNRQVYSKNKDYFENPIKLLDLNGDLIYWGEEQVTRLEGIINTDYDSFTDFADDISAFFEDNPHLLEKAMPWNKAIIKSQAPVVLRKFDYEKDSITEASEQLQNSNRMWYEDIIEETAIEGMIDPDIITGYFETQARYLQKMWNDDEWKEFGLGLAMQYHDHAGKEIETAFDLNGIMYLREKTGEQDLKEAKFDIEQLSEEDLEALAPVYEDQQNDGRYIESIDQFLARVGPSYVRTKREHPDAECISYVDPEYGIYSPELMEINVEETAEMTPEDHKEMFETFYAGPAIEGWFRHLKMHKVRQPTASEVETVITVLSKQYAQVMTDNPNAKPKIGYTPKHVPFIDRRITEVEVPQERRSM